MTAPRVGSTITLDGRTLTIQGVTEAKGSGYDLILEDSAGNLSVHHFPLAAVIAEAWESGEPVAVASGPGVRAIVRRA